ncbi:hypothetical protein C1646_762553 [Rhizophagus diaphanus]|nr:hypothetical protein C1646_762553 [Rhizophagus diaphanus] [Rhizophagus sp. MUCL 43196]
MDGEYHSRQLYNIPLKRKAIQLALIEWLEPAVSRSKGRRLQDPVWTYFIQTPLVTTGHFAAEYLYSLSKLRQDSIDQSLIKIFVCCGILFYIVKHLFFIEMFKKACPSYTLPFCDKLSGIMLSYLAVKIENKIDTIFKNTTNLTLEFLYQLQNLSIIKYTAQLIAEEIEKVLKDIRPNKFVAIITDNVANYGFLTASNEIVKFFKKSHQLEKYTKDLKIEVFRLVSVETSDTNYTDCFIALIRLANAVEQISVERDLNGFMGKKRTILDINTVEAMANIRHFYQNNSKLISSKKTHNDNEVQKLVNDSFFFDKVDYNKDNNNEDGYKKIFETQILNYEVYVLIEDNVDFTNAIFLNNKEEEKDENL